MKEYGFIEFLKERYELDDCKAQFDSSNPTTVTFQVKGPDASFSFYKFKKLDAENPASFADYLIVESTDDDLFDSATFKLHDEEYVLTVPWSITCVTARPDINVMAFEWEFTAILNTGRIPKKKKMRGAARCLLTVT